MLTEKEPRTGYRRRRALWTRPRCKRPGRRIEPLLKPLGVGGATLHFIAFVIGFGIIIFLHVVVGELAVKSFAIARPEGTS